MMAMKYRVHERWDGTQNLRDNGRPANRGLEAEASIETEKARKQVGHRKENREDGGQAVLCQPRHGGAGAAAGTCHTPSARACCSMNGASMLAKSALDIQPRRRPTRPVGRTMHAMMRRDLQRGSDNWSEKAKGGVCRPIGLSGRPRPRIAFSALVLSCSSSPNMRRGCPAVDPAIRYALQCL
jgi:hypothetical protein